MKVLLIHQAFSSGNDPGGTRHFEFGQKLDEFGDQLVVVGSQVSYVTGKRFQATNPRHSTVEVVEGVQIHRAYSPDFHHRSYPLRVVAFLVFMLTSLWAGFRVRQPTIVMGTSPPMFQAISALVVSKVRRTPFLLEIRDLWPDFAIHVGILKNPLMIWLSQKLAQFLYWSADHIIVNSPAYRTYLEQKGVPAERITLIPNGVSTEAFDPDDLGETFRQSSGLSDKLIVMYTGALGHSNDIDTILLCAEFLIEDPNIHFALVGDGKDKERLVARAHAQSLTNVSFFDAVPKNEIPAVLSAADVCVATLLPVPMFDMTYPNKVFDYMAAGRPTVLAIDGVIRDVIEQAKGGVFVRPGEGTTMALAIRELANNAHRRKQMGSSARLYVCEHFDRSHQARAFRDLLSALAANGSGTTID